MKAFRGAGQRPAKKDITVRAIVLAIGVAFMSQACMPLDHLSAVPTTDLTDVDLTELLVTQPELPKGWWAWDGPVSVPKVFPASIDSRGTWFRVRQKDGDVIARAYHAIGRYKSLHNARTWYEIEIEPRAFGQAGIVGGWYVPGELEYQSPVADRLRLACAKTTLSMEEQPQEECVAVGQYAEFISVFSASIHPDYMTYDTLENILAEIDRRFAEATGKPFPATDSP